MVLWTSLTFLCAYSHFREFSAFAKDLQIYILAFFKFLKQLVFFLPIAIHFPHSTALAILSFVINKSFHVFQRIAKKNPYFMWETSTFQKSIFQMFHAGIKSEHLRKPLYHSVSHWFPEVLPEQSVLPYGNS